METENYHNSDATQGKNSTFEKNKIYIVIEIAVSYTSIILKLI